MCDTMQEFIENYYSIELTGNLVESDSDHEDNFDEINIDFELDENMESEEREKEKPKEIPVVNSMEEKIEIVVVIYRNDDNDK